MFKWMKRKVELAAVNAATEDIERFINALRGASASEVSLIVAMATLVRLNLESMDRLPRYALDLRLPHDDWQVDRIQLYLNKMINQFQKMGQPSDATAAMVWLHSTRALNIPEVRYLGQKMWLELSRGFSDAADAAKEVCGIVGRPIPEKLESEVQFVPGGLE